MQAGQVERQDKTRGEQMVALMITTRDGEGQGSEGRHEGGGPGWLVLLLLLLLPPQVRVVCVL